MAGRNETQAMTLRRAMSFAVLAALLTGVVGTATSATEFRAGDDLDIRELIDRARDEVFPALVNIQLVTSQYWGGKEIKGQAVGSGTIISAQGHVLTNQHVTHNGRRFRCTLADKQEIPAELIGEDPLTDLAILKLDLSALEDPNMSLPVARLGDSSTLEVGDHVLAMGSPFALSRSVTLGVVSNTERVFAGGLGGGDPDDMRLERGQRTGLFTRWIQHDALILPGNSGGPLVNLAGEVIGVNELGGSSMGFAIPSNLAKQVAATLIAHGEVKRSWIGVSFKSIAKTGLEEGVLVNSVVDDSPATRAGLRSGDVVIRIDGAPITVRFVEEIPLLLKDIADREIGSTIAVTYRRRDVENTADIVTAKLEKDRGDERQFRAWGLTAMEITPFCCREHRLDNMEGVLVTGVREGGGASLAKPPLAFDDVIKTIDGRKVDDLAAFIEQYEAIMGSEEVPEYVLIVFERVGKNQVTLLKPKPDEDSDPPPELPKAWVGVAVQTVLANLAERLGDRKTIGFRITQVYPNTKAARSDLQVGDIITHLNGKGIKPSRREDVGRFHRAVKKLEIDAAVEITVVRDGEPLALTIELESTRTRPAEARRYRNRDFEITVREVTFFDRVDRRWKDDVRGVIVVSLERAGWAGLGGIRSGDLIQRIDDADAADLDSYREALKRITEKEPERVVFYLLRGVRTRLQHIEPEWNPSDRDKESKR